MKCGELAPVKQLFCLGIIRILGAGSPPTLPNLGPRPLQHFFVSRVLPPHQFFDYFEEAFAFSLLRLLGWEEVGITRRVVHHLSKDYGSRSCKRPPSPPEVQRTR